ncbi:MAG: 16S rRNA (guanine(527)-N(7))-methyltransferase RsmG [Flavobacteriaceae bacterium]|nr:16S rRNA (guanine(527)-N(7))-methyltransferase RsmG [Flavobacteriaceae bacterium]MDZ4148884.1 16S rRNA (guanine(527)-N(7))-methyltransferase RsmG [Flavobacteriaceae bacterium]
MQLIHKYFKNLTDEQIRQFSELERLYSDWNQKINVISRKDVEHLYERHVLHALSIAKVIEFLPQSKILDVGTGGGFPGIPLAILFPEVQFHLIDAIGKKIAVVQAISDALKLKNVKAEHIRADQVKNQYDFIVSRAVTNMPDFVKWVKGKVLKTNRHNLENGILYLKGGDLTEELKIYQKVTCFEISDFFEEAFFESKKVVFLPLKYKA